jgi:hypothetical protein
MPRTIRTEAIEYRNQRLTYTSHLADDVEHVCAAVPTTDIQRRLLSMGDFVPVVDNFIYSVQMTPSADGGTGNSEHFENYKQMSVPIMCAVTGYAGAVLQ